MAEDTGSETWTCSCIADFAVAAAGIDAAVVVAASSFVAPAVSAVVIAAPFASVVAEAAVVLSVFVVAVAVAASAFAALVVSVVVDTRLAAVTAVGADTVVVVEGYCRVEARSRCIHCPAHSPD